MTDEPTVADTVRRAARLLRERAAVATPGPWIAETHPEHGHRVGTVDKTGWVGWTGYLNDEAACRTDAEYIAAMHPAVALAIADSWDHQADDMDGTADVRETILFDDMGEDVMVVVDRSEHRHHDWTATLAAARALLGESS